MLVLPPKDRSSFPVGQGELSSNSVVLKTNRGFNPSSMVTGDEDTEPRSQLVYLVPQTIVLQTPGSVLSVTQDRGWVHRGSPRGPPGEEGLRGLTPTESTLFRPVRTLRLYSPLSPMPPHISHILSQGLDENHTVRGVSSCF